MRTELRSFEERASAKPIDRAVALALVLYVALLAVLPLVLASDTFAWFFSEEGPVEVAALVFWVVAAVVVLVRIRPLTARAWAFAGLYLAFAAREADLHRAFTADSMLKTSYYRRAVAPIEEKIIAGIVALVLVALFVYVLWVVARFLLRDRGWRSRAGGWLLAGVALLFFCKLLDRAPATLAEDFGVHVAPIVKMYTSAFEEGIEALLPLLLAFSAWISQDERRYLS